MDSPRYWSALCFMHAIGSCLGPVWICHIGALSDSGWCGVCRPQKPAGESRRRGTLLPPWPRRCPRVKRERPRRYGRAASQTAHLIQDSGAGWPIDPVPVGPAGAPSGRGAVRAGWRCAPHTYFVGFSFVLLLLFSPPLLFPPLPAAPHCVAMRAAHPHRPACGGWSCLTALTTHGAPVWLGAPPRHAQRLSLAGSRPRRSHSGGSPKSVVEGEGMAGGRTGQAHPPTHRVPHGGPCIWGGEGRPQPQRRARSSYLPPLPKNTLPHPPAAASPQRNKNETACRDLHGGAAAPDFLRRQLWAEAGQPLSLSLPHPGPHRQAVRRPFS